MKTAAEFLNDITNITYSQEEMMIVFAKLHVKAALEAADKEVPLHCSEGVLNCYPESNIV